MPSLQTVWAQYPLREFSRCARARILPRRAAGAPGQVLTVGTAIEAQAQSNLPAWVPGHRNDANVSCQDGVMQIMPHHPALIHIPKECLGMKGHCQHFAPGQGSLLPSEGPPPTGNPGPPPYPVAALLEEGFPARRVVSIEHNVACKPIIGVEGSLRGHCVDPVLLHQVDLEPGLLVPGVGGPATGACEGSGSAGPTAPHPSAPD